MPTTKLGNRTLLLMFVGAGLASGIAAVLFHARRSPPFSSSWS